MESPGLAVRSVGWGARAEMWEGQGTAEKCGVARVLAVGERLVSLQPGSGLQVERAAKTAVGAGDRPPPGAHI